MVAFPLVLASTVGVAVGGSDLLGAAVVACLLGVAVVLMAPRHWQWAGLLVAASLVPLSDLGVPSALTTLTPWAAVLGLMVLGITWPRPLPTAAPARCTVALLVLFSGWLCVSALLSQERTVSIGWLIAFLSLALLPPLLAFVDPHGVSSLRSAWIVMGGLLGTFAMIESFILQSNPIAGVLFAGSGLSGDNWSVYRATTTLGHPLTNGMYFSISCGLALFEFTRGRSRWHLLAASLSLGGAVASGSRGSVLAVLLTIVIALLPTRPALRPEVRVAGRKVLLLLLLILGAGTAVVVLSARVASSEGSESSAFRVAEIPVALDAMRDGPPFGLGPGVASMSYEGLLRQIGGAGAFESYWLELGVAAGVGGLMLGISTMAAFLLWGSVNRDWGGVAALAAWLVSASLTNAFEGGRAENLYLGLILAMVIVGPASGGRARGEDNVRVALRRGEGTT